MRCFLIAFVLMNVSTFASSSTKMTAKPYSQLVIAGAIHTQLKPGKDVNEIIINGPDKVLKHLVVETKGKELTIKVEDYNHDYKDLNVIIHQNELDSVVVAGASTFEGKLAKKNHFTISLAGAAKANIEVDSDQMEVNLAGASQLTVKGSSKTLEINSAGASVVSALELQCIEAEIQAFGASQVAVSVKDKLSLSSLGAATIRYKGNPKVSTSGLGPASVEHIQ